MATQVKEKTRAYSKEFMTLFQKTSHANIDLLITLEANGLLSNPVDSPIHSTDVKPLKTTQQQERVPLTPIRSPDRKSQSSSPITVPSPLNFIDYYPIGSTPFVNKENYAITPQRTIPKRPMHLPKSNSGDCLTYKAISASPTKPKLTNSTPPLRIQSPPATMPVVPPLKLSPTREGLDEHRLEQRQKQIDYGYRTLGYIRYRILVPKEKRSRECPRTPKKSQLCSKRSWDGQVKKWRRDLHLWDPKDEESFMKILNQQHLSKILSGDEDTSEMINIIVEDTTANAVMALDKVKSQSLSKLTPASVHKSTAARSLLIC